MRFLVVTHFISILWFYNIGLTNHCVAPNASTNDILSVNSILSCKLGLNENYLKTENSSHTSSLLKVKGYPEHLIYNRVPKAAGTTLRYLFRQQAEKRRYTILNKNIYVPFLLPFNVQQEVVSEFEDAKLPVIYERHMYFINFDVFQKPQPVYINVIRDPLQQVISSYYYSRSTCIDERRCYFNTTFVNETLNECVERRSASECIDASHGVSPVIPFFCGNEAACEQNKTYALEKAKQNIIDYYTVVGIVEELYNFLFVLEHLLPKYFANVRLLYISNGMKKENVRLNRSSDRNLSKTSQILLRAALANEYDLYEFIKTVFTSNFIKFYELWRLYDFKI
ncbi:hypothetical protein I4U23_022715 [Adineta vaga]|nr:hypothetical protein I4U23_022715 [Adineta vaga]